MAYINRTLVRTITNTKVEAIEAIEARVDTGLSQGNLVHTVQTVGLIMHPESARPMVRTVITAISKAYGKECYHCHKQ